MSKKNSKVIFRTAMGGYNKNDVNTYIENENRRFASAELEMSSEIKRLEDELEGARASLKRYDGVSESLANAKNELDLLKNELMNTKAELNRYKSAAEALDEAKGEITRLKDELNTVRGKLVVDENDKNTENAAESNVEEIDSVVASELIRKAKSASDEILLRAEVGAREIVERARKEVIDSRGDMISDAKDIFNAATSELRRSIGICMSDFITGIKTARGSAGKVTDDALRCDDELSQRIERMQNELDRAISEKLAEFDRKNKNVK